jgi:hypothetical protein
MRRSGDVSIGAVLPRCAAGRFPPAANRVPDGLVGLPLRPSLVDRRHEDRLIEPRTHPINDVMVEGLVRLELVSHRAELRLLFMRILLAGFLAVRRGLLAESTGGHDLGQPDAVALGLVLGKPFLAPLLARVLGKDIEAAGTLLFPDEARARFEIVSRGSSTPSASRPPPNNGWLKNDCRAQGISYCRWSQSAMRAKNPRARRLRRLRR